MSAPIGSAAATPGRAAGAWRHYRRDDLADDLVAAAIVTVLLVPQSLAYALLAGLPPVAGVMASLLPIVGYAAFGSSTTLAVGPVAVLAMMTAAATAPVAAAHGVGPHLASLVLAAEMAAVFGIAALLRLDVFAALLSAPVLHGFMTGAAIAIAIGQLPGLLGIAVKGTTLAELVPALLAAPTLAPQAATALVGLATLAFLWLARRHGARLLRACGLGPHAAQLGGRIAPMLAVLAAIGAVAAFPAALAGVALVGPVDLGEGLRFAPPWHAPWGVWVDLAVPALLLGLVAYVESLAVAEALAARRDEKIVPRRELLGLAAANAGAAVGGGMPVTGGFARSIVNFDAGARTRLAGVWTALLLAGAIALAGDALGRLPKAVLAATIVVAVLSLVDRGPFVEAWRYARREALLMGGVALLTVVAGVELALGLGVLASAAMLLQRTARPHWAEVGRLPGTTDVFRNVRRFEVETLPGVLSIRVDESLLFTNTRWLVDTLGAAPRERPGLRHVVLMMSGVNDIDVTGLEGLKALSRELRGQGVALHLSELKGPVMDRLRRVEPEAWLGGRIFRTQGEAHAALAAGIAPPSAG